MATTPEAVARLWEVCQVPDYRKISPATHAELAMTLFGFLMRDGKIPTTGSPRRSTRPTTTDGDIDTLSNRIAHIRTWTFAANRPDWLADPEHWQGVTRAVEDKLSDALHERLTERFVDRRTSVLMRRLRENSVLETDISKTGEVVVEGHSIGRLDGFTFTPDASAAGSEAKTLAGAAQKALAGEIDARAGRLAQAPATSSSCWRPTASSAGWASRSASIVAAEEVLKPRVRIIADEQLTGAPRDSVQARLDLWLKTHIEKLLGPLFQLATAEDMTGLARGVAFQLAEALGVLERGKVAEDVKASTSRRARRCANTACASAPITSMCRRCSSRRRACSRRSSTRSSTTARQQGPRGDPAARRLGPHLDRRRQGRSRTRSIASPAIASAASARCASTFSSGSPTSSVRRSPGAPGAPGPQPAAAADGYGFVVTTAMTSLAGCSGEDFASVLRALGYRMEKRPKPPRAACRLPRATAAEAPASEAAPARCGDGRSNDG